MREAEKAADESKREMEATEPSHVSLFLPLLYQNNLEGVPKKGTQGGEIDI